LYAKKSSVSLCETAFYKSTLLSYISQNDFIKNMEIDPKNLNQSIIKAFTLLDAFTTDKKEWGVRELATKSGYNKSTTYRLLSTLVSLQVVQQNENEKYSLGSKLFELGNRVSLYQSLINATKIAIRDIAIDIQETVLYGVIKDHQVFYINKAESVQGLKISTSVGSYQPIHATAIGKVLTAFSSDEKQQNLLKLTNFNSYTKNTIINKSNFITELKKIKTQGYALDLEEFELGLVCVAIPVFNNNNKLIGSISASGPSSRFELKNVKNYITILKNGAHKINL
jgi:IclR family KDG regulon transcriptional repressor